MQNGDEFFMPLENTRPYFKAGFMGFAGSGKTRTMGLVAAGLHERIDSKKPVVYFDTERAASHMRELFASYGIQVLVRQSRSLADLKEAMKRCRDGASDILIIDSLTHIWKAFVEAYRLKTKRGRLEFQDWGIIKPAWEAEFSDPFVRDPYHCMFTGRAGFEYDTEVNETTGKRDMFKSGIKMKVEGETAYEPDMLVLMEHQEDVLGNEKRVWREATILKDRSTRIDGRTFKNPTFEDFAPAIDAILANPSKAKQAPERDAAALIKTEEDRQTFGRERDICLEEIKGIIEGAGLGGHGGEAKARKVQAFEAAFGTSSWTKISSMMPSDLRDGAAKLRFAIAAQSPIAPAAAEPQDPIASMGKDIDAAATVQRCSDLIQAAQSLPDGQAKKDLINRLYTKRFELSQAATAS
jgi:hypothetical protein